MNETAVIVLVAFCVAFIVGTSVGMALLPVRRLRWTLKWPRACIGVSLIAAVAAYLASLWVMLP